MDSSFIIYDHDISLNEEILNDLELRGDNSFIWNLEPAEQELFPETLELQTSGNSQGLNENQESLSLITTENIDYFNSTSCSETNSRQDKDDNELPLPQTGVYFPLTNVEQKKTGFQCTECGKYFVQKSSCNRHKVEKHLKPNRFQCHKCGLRFSKKFNLQQHQKRAHAKVNHQLHSTHKCSYCSCVYSNSAVLKKHIKTYHTDNQGSDNIQPAEDNDPQREAENVLKQLMMLQKDIEETNLNKSSKAKENEYINTTKVSNTEIVTELTTVDEAEVQMILVKDRLYPYEEVHELKVQQITRKDGLKYLVCEFCSKEFRKSYGYLRHRRIHCLIKPFICVLCKKSFPTQNQLKRHSKKHTIMDSQGNYKSCYKCPKCYEAQSSLNLFDQHISTHLPDTSFVFQCLTCNKSYKTLGSYFRHEHKDNDPDLDMLKSLLPAPLCLMNGKEISSVLSHDNNNTYPCSLCGLKLSCPLAVKQHEKRHRNLRNHQCHICNGFYASKTSLEVHLKIHLNQCNFKCLKCSKLFCTKFQLKRHELRHCNIKKYKCRYCDEMFKTSQYCRSHMLSHLKKLIETKQTSQQPKPNVVSVQTLMQNKKDNEIIITEVQILKSKNKSHITNAKNEAKNGDELPYECLKCSLKFRYNAWLKKHEAQVHSADRPFKCDKCEKSFRKNQALKSHLLIHKNECIKQTCLVCGKKYASEKSLKVHLRIHTEEKPFNCELCEKSFRTSGHLIQHRKSNHKDGCI